jgi:hypothetical protein
MTHGDELSRLLEAERAVRPPSDAMERGLSRLLTDVGQHVAPLPIASGSLRLGLSLVSKWLITGFVLGLGGAGVASQLWSTSSVAAPSTLPAGEIALVSVAIPASSEPPPERAETAMDRPALVVPLRAAPAASPAGSALDATTFDEELRLISAAKRELERGQAQAASGWLAEHAQRFANGVFALDREALSILVACSAERQPSLAEAFAARHPQSPMVARLLRACRGREAPSARDFSEVGK